MNLAAIDSPALRVERFTSPDESPRAEFKAMYATLLRVGDEILDMSAYCDWIRLATILRNTPARFRIGEFLDMSNKKWSNLPASYKEQK